MSTSKHTYSFRWKKLSIGSSELWMIALVVAAVLLRFMLISNNWPTTNSDEATMGLMAKVDSGFQQILDRYFSQIVYLLW